MNCVLNLYTEITVTPVGGDPRSRVRIDFTYKLVVRHTVVRLELVRLVSHPNINPFLADKANFYDNLNFCDT